MSGPKRDNDFLGDEALPVDIRVIEQELRAFFELTEMQIGWLNVVSAEGYLNEQPAVYRSRLLHWMTKAIRQNNKQFFRDLTQAMSGALAGKPTAELTRQLIQAAGALNAEAKTERVECLLGKLRNPDAHDDIGAIQEELVAHLAVGAKHFRLEDDAENVVSLSKYATSSPETPKRTHTQVLHRWERRTGRRRESINVYREMKKAGLLELARGKPGRPRKRKIRRAKKANVTGFG